MMWLWVCLETVVRMQKKHVASLGSLIPSMHKWNHFSVLQAGQGLASFPGVEEGEEPGTEARQGLGTRLRLRRLVNIQVYLYFFYIYSVGPMLIGMQPSIVVLTPTMALKLWIRLKYSHLPRRRSLTLSQVAALLIEEFLPDAFQKYLFQNFKQTAFNRVYNDSVPSYLHGRPRQVLLHCLHRNLAVTNSKRMI